MEGMGFRSQAETCGVAFLGALEQAVPCLVTIEALQVVVGGDDCWGDAALPEGRWQVILESGTRDGEELQKVWDTLKKEASDAAQWLERELEGAMAVNFESVGDGSTSGGTRGVMIEERDQGASS